LAIRFRKTFKIAPGVKLNVGKKSGSVRVGGKNAGITLGSASRSIGASLPGTGLGVSIQKRGGCFGAAVTIVGIALLSVAVASLWPEHVVASETSGFNEGLSYK
jgi:hypothetical protein